MHEESIKRRFNILKEILLRNNQNFLAFLKKQSNILEIFFLIYLKISTAKMDLCLIVSIVFVFSEQNDFQCCGLGTNS